MASPSQSQRLLVRIARIVTFTAQKPPQSFVEHSLQKVNATVTRILSTIENFSQKGKSSAI